MRFKPVSTLVVAVLILIPVCVFSQGLYWESKTSGSRGEWTSKSYYMPKMFKIISGEGNQEMIFRLDQEKIYRVQPDKKTYTEMTFEDLEKTAKSMQAKMDERQKDMQERLKQMPEEQRKQMERMMPGMMGRGDDNQPVVVKKTGETKTISGFACAKYVAPRGEKEVVTIWATKDLKGLDQMKKDLGEFSKRMSALNPMGRSMYETMEKIDGFTIQTDMGMGFSTVVTKVDHRSTPASDFEVPSGYAKVKEEMPGEGRKPE